jgi:hypothetical protein
LIGSVVVPKHILKSLDMTTLLVALDHLEEYGPSTAVPDLEASPGEAAYLTYIGEEQIAAIAARLPHADVRFKVPGRAGKTKVVRKLFNKAALIHVLKFAYPNGPDFLPFVRSLDTVDKQYWRVLPPNSDPPA